jgi:hypothetical protein
MSGRPPVGNYLGRPGADPADRGLPHAFAARRARPRPLILSVYGSAAVTAVFMTLLAWLVAETRDGSVLGLAERLTSSIQTCWPFITAVTLLRTRRSPDPGDAGLPARARP